MIEKLQCGCDYFNQYDYFWNSKPINLVEELDEEAYDYLCDAAKNYAIWWKNTGLYIVSEDIHSNILCIGGKKHFFVFIDEHKRLFSAFIHTKEMQNHLRFVRKEDVSIWNKLEEMLNANV